MQTKKEIKTEKPTEIERKEELQGMSYSDLQEVAKSLSIAANQSAESLVEKILDTEYEDVVEVAPIEEEEESLDIDIKVDTRPIRTEPKNVRVRMKEDHKCSIGGERYYLLKEKHYNVPENVKNILAKAGLLLPL